MRKDTYEPGKYYGAVLSELGIVQDKLLCYYAAELIEKCVLYRNLYQTQLVARGK